MYNKAELKAMQMIASKLNWHKPAYETVETIYKMVCNQQALELDCVGECDDFEETLLSMALWDADKIGSTLFINDYHSLVNYKYLLFLEDMGLTDSDYKAMLDYYVNISGEAMADEDYMIECMEEAMFYDMLETQLDAAPNCWH
jgi:hypothetical protein